MAKPIESTMLALILATLTTSCHGAASPGGQTDPVMKPINERKLLDALEHLLEKKTNKIGSNAVVQAGQAVSPDTASYAPVEQLISPSEESDNEPLEVARRSFTMGCRSSFSRLCQALYSSAGKRGLPNKREYLNESNNPKLEQTGLQHILKSLREREYRRQSIDQLALPARFETKGGNSRTQLQREYERMKDLALRLYKVIDMEEQEVL